MSYSEKIKVLFDEQLQEWELAKINYDQLARINSRSLDFGSYRIELQFNPGRIRSSAAKVDTKSIGERPCFLCSKNRPDAQKSLGYDDNLSILVNPYPIFNRHLTIVSYEHTDQRIFRYFSSMLKLSMEMNEFLFFYNGPECGASAPDHFHLQAGNKGLLPIEADFENRRCCNLLASIGLTEIWIWHDYGRGIATLKGSDMVGINNIFGDLFTELHLSQPEKPEPMLNLITSFTKGEWVVHIIPRKAHRPAQFFADGDQNILVSPASVDLGGLLITPREKDFNNITNGIVNDIFKQVCYGEEEIVNLFKRLR